MPSVITPKFRVSYPSVFKPRAFDGQEPTYSLEALFPKGTDLSKLEAAIEAEIQKKWAGKTPKNLKRPMFKEQGDKAASGYEAGAKYLSLKSKRRPGLVDRKLQPIIDETEFYPGCYAIAQVSVYAWTHKTGGAGVSFSLENLQKVEEGEPLAGRVRAENVFTAFDTSDADAIFG